MSDADRTLFYPGNFNQNPKLFNNFSDPPFIIEKYIPLQGRDSGGLSLPVSNATGNRPAVKKKQTSPFKDIHDLNHFPRIRR